MDIVKLRIKKKNELNNRLRDIDNKIKYNERTIVSLKMSDMDPNYINNQITIITEKITSLNKDKSSLTEELNDIDKGESDNSITEKINVTSNIVNNKHKKALIKKYNEEARKKEGNKVLKKYQEQERNECRKHYRKLTQINYEYRRYLHICNTIPNFMLNNLKNMPNNKGYIFKGLYLYGEKDTVKGEPIVLFEKPNKNTLWIHEWIKDVYSKYEKIDNNKKKLIQRYTRKIIPHPHSFSEYINHV